MNTFEWGFAFGWLGALLVMIGTLGLLVWLDVRRARRRRAMLAAAPLFTPEPPDPLIALVRSMQGQPTPGCNCPVCRTRRGGEAPLA